MYVKMSRLYSQQVMWLVPYRGRYNKGRLRLFTNQTSLDITVVQITQAPWVKSAQQWAVSKHKEIHQLEQDHD